MLESIIPCLITGVFGIVTVLITENAKKAKEKAEQERRYLADEQERVLFRQKMEAEMDELKRISKEQAAHLKEHNGYGKLFADMSAEINIKLARLETIIEERTNK